MSVFEREGERKGEERRGEEREKENVCVSSSRKDVGDLEMVKTVPDFKVW